MPRLALPLVGQRLSLGITALLLPLLGLTNCTVSDRPGASTAGASTTGGGSGVAGAPMAETSGNTAGSATGGSATGSCSPNYLLCEDFESTAVGSVPTGWTAHGKASVAEDQAGHGTHSLKITPADNGERRIYHATAMLGGQHWGRQASVSVQRATVR